MERVTGIEPVYLPWQGSVLPMYYTRTEKEPDNTTESGEGLQDAKNSKIQKPNSNNLVSVWNLEFCVLVFMLGTVRDSYSGSTQASQA